MIDVRGIQLNMPQDNNGPQGGAEAGVSWMTPVPEARVVVGWDSPFSKQYLSFPRYHPRLCCDVSRRRPDPATVRRNAPCRPFVQ